ncbi:MAG: 2-oxoacid:acceptor oxidoreductase family protein [Thermovirgaceae bacterium]|jgi:pyruvate ferredoxin oxidoreductase gamma subunit|nr:2-oxoacid:acceptor oxidoreductase family protein [Synergistales bacterium]MDI9392109.1 2-oxoacid:acceptor oxidoreductase family protein [Synergistota bacterium]MDY0178551.1 2-oxoacid:acceptor oxidoreductase family protein [Synergistaceae bacterium]HRW87495.1 2-oxoacid:acceptor oxidoreductase family protein [Thermovirgaceae bacterium]MDD3133669.1 2-oxoacid:acceptor oxidoreductase family protein [Synergistales bacterium]
MSKVIEVRWHGRGGQGAKTGSAILAEVLFEAGKHTQSFPEYGAERQGAPMKAFNRVSDRPIRDRSGVLNPDIVVLIDPTLIEAVKPTEGGKETTVYLINAPESPAIVKKKLGLKDSIKLMTVDATRITLEEFGQNRPNTPMLGALAHFFKDVPVDAFIEHFTHKMGAKLPEKVLKANQNAIRRGYEEVQQG